MDKAELTFLHSYHENIRALQDELDRAKYLLSNTIRKIPNSSNQLAISRAKFEMEECLDETRTKVRQLLRKQSVQLRSFLGNPQLWLKHYKSRPPTPSKKISKSNRRLNRSRSLTPRQKSKTFSEVIRSPITNKSVMQQTVESECGRSPTENSDFTNSDLSIQVDNTREMDDFESTQTAKDHLDDQENSLVMDSGELEVFTQTINVDNQVSKQLKEGVLKSQDFSLMLQLRSILRKKLTNIFENINAGCDKSKIDQISQIFLKMDSSQCEQVLKLQKDIQCINESIQALQKRKTNNEDIHCAFTQLSATRPEKIAGKCQELTFVKQSTELNSKEQPICFKHNTPCNDTDLFENIFQSVSLENKPQEARDQFAQESVPCESKKDKLENSGSITENFRLPLPTSQKAVLEDDSQDLLFQTPRYGTGIAQSPLHSMSPFVSPIPTIRGSGKAALSYSPSFLLSPMRNSSLLFNSQEAPICPINFAERGCGSTLRQREAHGIDVSTHSKYFKNDESVEPNEESNEESNNEKIDAKTACTHSRLHVARIGKLSIYPNQAEENRLSQKSISTCDLNSKAVTNSKHVNTLVCESKTRTPLRCTKVFSEESHRTDDHRNQLKCQLHINRNKVTLSQPKKFHSSDFSSLPNHMDLRKSLSLALREKVKL